MNEFQVSRNAHKRILLIIAAKDCSVLTVLDDALLQSMFLTGHIEDGAEVSDDLSTVRLTTEGWRYLAHLSEQS